MIMRRVFPLTCQLFSVVFKPEEPVRLALKRPENTYIQIKQTDMSVDLYPKPEP